MQNSLDEVLKTWEQTITVFLGRCYKLGSLTTCCIHSVFLAGKEKRSQQDEEWRLRCASGALSTATTQLLTRHIARTAHQPSETQKYKRPCQPSTVMSEKSWRWHCCCQKLFKAHTLKKGSYISSLAAGGVLPLTWLDLLTALTSVLSALIQFTFDDVYGKKRKEKQQSHNWSAMEFTSP